ALYINSEFEIGADLEVIPVKNWKRDQLTRDIDFPWISPSPNMPTPETAMVYPGQVIWEGTNVSEGRGTTLPFELFGAPYFDHDSVLEYIRNTQLPGCFIRPVAFLPTSGKWAGELCRGFQLHVTDQKKFMPYRTSLVFLQAALHLFPQDFKYKEPPYEYEFKRLPMDLILGDSSLRTALESGTSVIELEKGWQDELQSFDKRRRSYFLYT
ncbi:MAG: exo-beta-N-acetylmuramidase NamZ domain-containing protein, partial [Desulforhopalus sp.]